MHTTFRDEAAEPGRSASRRQRALLCTILALATTFAGCTGPKTIDTPMLDARNPEHRVPHRIEAAELAWAGVQDDPDQRAKAREVFKSLVWSTETPRPLRLRILEMLLQDRSPEGLADSRSFVTLRLPTEPDRAAVGMMAVAAAAEGWTEAIPSLVRRLAEPIDDVPDAERVEAIALQRLEPGKSLDRIVFEQFAEPGVGDSAGALGWDERTRADAWTLLSRLDPTGEARRDLILDPGPAALGAAGPLLADLRAGVTDLGVVPSTAMELDWLRSLRAGGDKERAWWNEVSSLVAGLSPEQRDGLQLRHLEPIRLASRKSPRLLQEGRDELIGELENRLRGRDHHRRTAELDGTRAAIRERIEQRKDELSWGDALALITIDEAIAAPGIAATLFQQARLDREDRQTEYGGVLEAVTSPDGRVGGYRLVLFPPRPRDRVHDEQFIASQDMIDYSGHALAHYHMQVQRERNNEFAGPSSGDLRYARMSGRGCVVFTSLSADRMAVDYYQPDGVVIDLGEITR